MRIRLKPLDQQVILVTGATSGVGLTTTREAARAGARLMLVSRNERALKEICDALALEGADVHYAVADVADYASVEAAAAAAVERFGRIDTWVNNAGVSVYGRFDEVPVEDQKRLFDTNYWGVVHGSLIALKLMRETGGAIINLGSELSDVAVPLQGTYSASKHAIKGFTEALRIEIAQARIPVSVTLIKPAGMDTMYVQHAKSYLKFEPKLPVPVYSPIIAAGAILHAAQNPKRDIYVGGASKATVIGNRIAPGLTDTLLTLFGVRMQDSGRPSRTWGQALFAPSENFGQEQSGRNGRIVRSSGYTSLTTTHRGSLRLLSYALIGVTFAASLRLWNQKAMAKRR